MTKMIKPKKAPCIGCLRKWAKDKGFSLVSSGKSGLKKLGKGGWIRKAAASIKRRKTKGVCTGSKFGGPSCPAGSKRYNLAKVFKKIGRNRKKK